MKEWNPSLWRQEREGFPGYVCGERCRQGSPIRWARCCLVGEWEEDPGDEEVLARAHSDGRILVTLDKDFGKLAIVHRTPHSGIIRLANFPARQQGLVCLKLLARYGEELLAGAIVTADSRRIRT